MTSKIMTKTETANKAKDSNKKTKAHQKKNKDSNRKASLVALWGNQKATTLTNMIKTQNKNQRHRQKQGTDEKKGKGSWERVWGKHQSGNILI